jgi:hypothetical protein
MSNRVMDIGWWRRRRAARLDAPPKDHVHASSDELLAARLRGLRLPSPPSSIRERSKERYREQLGERSARNRWRD